MLVLTDSGVVLTGAAEVICPAAAKLYIVRNTTGQSATIKTSAGTGVAIPNGFTSFVFCDGTNVVQAVTRIQGASVDFATLKGTGTVVVTNILDEDNMVSDSATALATQQSIKAYVDAQIAANDTLAEILANGNTTGGTDIAVSAGDDITFTDTSKAIFGVGGDLQVYHDGSNSFIVDSGTGALNIQTDALSIKNAAGTETMITATENGAVVLSFDNAARVTTGSTGVAVEGNLSATGDVRVGILNTDADITTNGTGTLVLSTNEGTNSGTITIAQGVDGNITLDPNGTGKVAIDAALISGGTINNTSIGASTASTGAFTTLAYTGTLTGGTGVINIGSGQLYKDASGNVGIGTSSPANLLDVNFSVSGNNNSGLTITNTNTAGWGGSVSFAHRVESSGAIATRSQINSEGGSNNSFMRFLTTVGGTLSERMRITSAGNVGIGTSAPGAKLEVKGGGIVVGNNAQAGTPTNLVVSNNGDQLANRGVAIDLNVPTAGFPDGLPGARITSAASASSGFGGYLSFATINTSGALPERMRITDAGNVGIGTSSPAGTLEIQANANNNLIIRDNRTAASGSFDNSIEFREFGASVTAAIRAQHNGFVGSSARALKFDTNAVERMRITGTGLVGIGTASPGGGNLDVNGFDGNIRVSNTASDASNKFGRLILRHFNNTSSDVFLVGGLASATDNEVYIGGGSAVLNQATQIRFFTTANTTTVGSTERMRITSDGNVGIGTSSPSGRLNVSGPMFVGTQNTGAESYLDVYLRDGGASPAAVLVNMRGSASGSENIPFTQPHLALSRGATNQGTFIRFTNQRAGFSGIGSTAGSDNAHDLRMYTGDGTERMRITSAGNVLIGKTTATANGGDLQVSSGITFPATQVAKSDANTLDDYEEGTFTPGITFGGGNTGMTFSVQTGQYTKIGRLVYVRINIRFTSKGSSTGNAVITGLPFTPISTPGGFSGQTLGISSQNGFSSITAPITASTGENVTTVGLAQVFGTSASTLTDANFNGDSNNYFSVTGCYATST
jgi:hypothetical protein